MSFPSEASFPSLEGGNSRGSLLTGITTESLPLWLVLKERGKNLKVVFNCHISESEFILAFWLSYLGTVFKKSISLGFEKKPYIICWDATQRLRGPRFKELSPRKGFPFTFHESCLVSTGPPISTIQVERAGLHLKNRPDAPAPPTLSRVSPAL